MRINIEKEMSPEKSEDLRYIIAVFKYLKGHVAELRDHILI